MKLTEKEHEATRLQLNLWLELKEHPGWKLFEQLALSEEERFLKDAMRLGQSPNDMALQLGSYRVANSYRTFADRNIQHARLMLASHDEAVEHEDPRKRR